VKLKVNNYRLQKGREKNVNPLVWILVKHVKSERKGFLMRGDAKTSVASNGNKYGVRDGVAKVMLRKGISGPALYTFGGGV